MNAKLVGDTIGGHVQRLVRQGLTAASGFLAANHFGGFSTEQIDQTSASAGGLVTAIVVGAIAYGWSTFRAKVLKERI